LNLMNPVNTFRTRTLILLVFFIPVLISCKSGPGKSGDTATEKAPQENAARAHTSAPDPTAEMELQDAALNGQFSIAEDLIRKGINVNAADPDGRTALMYASFNGHTEIVRMLLKSGAGIGLRDAAGRTALLYASTGPFPETVKLLLENNADPNIPDAQEAFTPLMHAAAEGHLEVVKVLLEYGADPSMKDVDGDDARVFALQNGHSEVAELLGSK
jgi:ankyrin repeat protein